MGGRLCVLCFVLLMSGLVLSGASDGIEDKVVIDSYINKGWNLIYGFVEPDQIIEGDIEESSIKVIYALMPNLQDYVMAWPNPEWDKIGTMDDDDVLNTGMWVYSDTSGEMIYGPHASVIPLDKRVVLKGWNFVGVTEDMIGSKLGDLAGDCEIERSYVFDSKNQGWDGLLPDVIPDNSAIGQTWVISVEDDCNLGRIIPEPPMLPEVPALPGDEEDIVICSKCPDLNGDGKVDNEDSTLFVNCVYHGKECEAKYDLNGDGMYTIIGDNPCIVDNLGKGAEEIDVCGEEEPECVVGSWSWLNNYQCNGTMKQRQQQRTACPSGYDYLWVNYACLTGEVCSGSGSCVDEEEPECSKCPDLNGDGKVDNEDSTLFVNCVYHGKECEAKYDLNGDGMYTIIGDNPCIVDNLGKGAEEIDVCGEGTRDPDNSSLQTLGENKKNLSKYSDRESFLISDKTWKDVLPLVPVVTWNGSEDCQRGYETADGVCVYPTLIYHEEEEIKSIKLDEDDFDFHIGDSNFELVEVHFSKLELAAGEKLILTASVKNGYDEVAMGSGVCLESYPPLINLDSEMCVYRESFEAGEAKEYEFVFSFKENNGGFDADSIIYFMQQYNVEKVTIVGESPEELDNLLVVVPELGAGLDEKQIQRIRVDDYLSYWEAFDTVVYVEDDYELALLASTYASLINAPLIIEGESLDSDVIFKGRGIVCVGDTGRDCSERLDLEQLQQKYVDDTGTDKIILVNPDDLNINVDEEFFTDKSSNSIYELYGKTSLASSILASAKHEVIISTTATDYREIDQLIEEKIDLLMPGIINNKNGLKRNNNQRPTTKLYGQNIESGEKYPVKIINSYVEKMIFDNGNILFKDESFYIYNVDNRNLQKIRGAYQSHSYDFSRDRIFYGTWDSYSSECTLYLYNILTGENLFVDSYSNYCGEVRIEGDNLVWIKETGRGVCNADKTTVCSSYEDCQNSCSDGSPCDENDDCGEGDWCYSGYCNLDYELYLKEGTGKKQKITTLEDISYRSLGISGDNIIFMGGDFGERSVNIYNIDSKQTEILPDSDLESLKIDGDYIIFNKMKYSDEDGWRYGLYLYDINTKQEIFIHDIYERSSSQIYNGKVLWLGSDKVCEISGESCSVRDDCKSFYSISGDECIVGDDDSSAGGYCSYENCVSTKMYVYDIISSQIIDVEIPVGTRNLIIKDNELFYINEEKYDFYISGFLTIFAAPNAIPSREYIGTLGSFDNYRSLDHTEYGDVYLDDRYSDMSVGRIQGITISDVSSYVARDLFYDKIKDTNDIQFMASSFDYQLRFAHNWTNSFNDAGYNAHCSIIPTETTSGTELDCNVDDNTNNWPSLWENNNLIFYMDHGSSSWAGIPSDEIPYLWNSIVYNDACSTCSTYNSHSFCNNVIRKGGLGHMGALGIAWTGNKIYRSTMNGIYMGDELTLGESFAVAYEYSSTTYMTTLLGDPTLDISPDYNLKEVLPW